jgi:hypothetical protein
MNIASSCPKRSARQTARCPLAEALPLPVETRPVAERGAAAARYMRVMVGFGDAPVNDVKKDRPPPAVHSAPPERDLERELKANPDDPNLKADVGSDESMDASDPLSAAQPGGSDEPAPSSGFPD